MVKYWKSKDAVEAKLTKKDGASILVLDGEKYPIWGIPRGHLLIPSNKNAKSDPNTLQGRFDRYSPFGVLKHDLKQVFNRAWEKLDQGVPREQVIAEGKVQLKEALKIIEYLKYDLMPPETMCPAVREIHRALTKVDCPQDFRDALTLVLQEDDGYRYRVSWMAIWYPWIKWNPIKLFDYGLKMIERAEVIGDMKRKIKLLRRILSLALEDPNIKDKFIRFFKEVNWRKVRITEAERYHFRAKYFRCDMDVLEY